MSLNTEGPALYRGDLPEFAASAFRDAGRIAWDIETTGLDWRTDRLGLCQLYAPAAGVAVIQIAEDVPRNLVDLLSDPTVQKVFHHAPFDLRFMTHHWEVEAESVRCTKVASKLLRPEAPNSQHSLAPLVEQYLGVALAKGAVRTSNWQAAHLSREQVQYAVNDVLHLLPLHDLLQRRLREVGRLELFDACCSFLPARVQLDLMKAPDVFAY